LLNPSKEQEREWQEERRRLFAKYCWANSSKAAPSGLTWAEVFKKVEGMSLGQYAEQIKQRQQEKNESHKEQAGFQKTLL